MGASLLRQVMETICAQAEIQQLEEQVAALQKQIGQAELKSVKEKAELATMTRFAVMRRAKQQHACDAQVSLRARLRISTIKACPSFLIVCLRYSMKRSSSRDSSAFVRCR